MKRERKAEVQRRNNLLLDKLFTIDRNPSRLTTQRPKTASSLNRHIREKELDRIDHENRKILHKIQTAYSKYSAEEIMRSSTTSQMYNGIY